MEATDLFLSVTLFPQISEIISSGEALETRARLQQAVNAAEPGPKKSVKYKVLKEEGPPHLIKYTVGVFLHEKKIGEGLL
jgi:dsRNA-specific ribonuclease